MYRKNALNKKNIQKVRFNNRDFADFFSSVGLLGSGFKRYVKLLVLEIVFI